MRSQWTGETGRDRRGGGVIFTLIFISVAGITAGALLNASITSRKLAHRDYCRERAMYAAESGFETVCQKIQSVYGVLPATFVTNGTIGDGTWSCTATKLGEYLFKLDCTGVVEDVRWCVHSGRVEAPSWAEFALWMHVNGVIYFWAGETFDGKVHSNDKLWFQPSGGVGPVFHDTLSSATNTFGGSTNGSVFDKGFILNADQDSMATVDFATMKSQALTYGNLLAGNTYITFNGNNMRVTNARSGWTNYNLAVGTNKIIYVQRATTGASGTMRGTLEIGGRVDGRVTIVAEDDIMITNHITYAEDPRTNASANDAVGLVTMDDIWITTNAPNNLNIFAAMMATGVLTNESGSFGVTNYNSGPTRGTLTVHGSIVQEVRGAVNTASSGIIQTGYAKNYAYDRRFSIQAPPYFPRLKTKISYGEWREGGI